LLASAAKSSEVTYEIAKPDPFLACVGLLSAGINGDCDPLAARPGAELCSKEQHFFMNQRCKVCQIAQRSRNVSAILGEPWRWEDAQNHPGVLNSEDSRSSQRRDAIQRTLRRTENEKW